MEGWNWGYLLSQPTTAAPFTQLAGDRWHDWRLNLNGGSLDTNANCSICNGENITLTANSFSPFGTVSYLWSTGETTPSITVSPNTTTILFRHGNRRCEWLF